MANNKARRTTVWSGFGTWSWRVLGDEIDQDGKNGSPLANVSVTMADNYRRFITANKIARTMAVSPSGT